MVLTTSTSRTLLRLPLTDAVIQQQKLGQSHRHRAYRRLVGARSDSELRAVSGQAGPLGSGAGQIVRRGIGEEVNASELLSQMSSGNERRSGVIGTLINTHQADNAYITCGTRIAFAMSYKFKTGIPCARKTQSKQCFGSFLQDVFNMFTKFKITANDYL